jgi:peptidoglycan/xylan/chitin deacetylase (PgdA/CDA1 family)
VARCLADSVELTFDDGPDPVWTPAVLAALSGSSLRATFFVVALRAAANPRLVAATRAAGHAVELHCYEHVRHNEVDRPTVEEDTRRALATLADLGVHPRRWRTPDGIEAPWTQEIAAAHDLQLCGWDVDSHDWRGDVAEQMLAAVGPELHEGAVVLLHDGLGPGALREGCSETVRFTRMIAAESVAGALCQRDSGERGLARGV